MLTEGGKKKLWEPWAAWSCGLTIVDVGEVKMCWPRWNWEARVRWGMLSILVVSNDWGQLFGWSRFGLADWRRVWSKSQRTWRRFSSLPKLVGAWGGSTHLPLTPPRALRLAASHDLCHTNQLARVSGCLCALLALCLVWSRTPYCCLLGRDRSPFPSRTQLDVFWSRSRNNSHHAYLPATQSAFSSRINGASTW